MIFLLNRRYMPYYKWSFRAARDLPVLREAAGELERLAGGPVRTEERIEGVCRAVVQELKRQGLTGGDWDYLEPHAMELTERIRDGELRNLHVMEG